MRLGIFSDIHFQKKGLARIRKTGEWIVETFVASGVDRVICLGDVLNTREMVSVEAQAEAFELLERMSELWPTDILLGNHDMNLKHSRRWSSLEGLTFSPRITLHREMGLSPLTSEISGLMIPYHEDQDPIIELLKKIPPAKAERTIVFGHLAINGAVTNTKYGTKFKGALGIDAFNPFRRTFAGHFHVVQTWNDKVHYVGSPQQFDFGDAGDQRGVVIYDVETDTPYNVVNPHCNAFHFLNAEEVQEALASPEKYRDTFVTLIYSDIVSQADHDRHVEALTGIGVLDVRKESVVEKAIREQAIEIEGVSHGSILDLIPPFVDAVLAEDSVLDRDKLVTFGEKIVGLVNSRHDDVAKSGAIFDSEPTCVALENFMGFRGPYEFPLSEMDGLWFSEGENGAGKSTLPEALVWCVFGKQIRSKTKADDVWNDKVNNGRGLGCYVRVDFANGYSFERWRKYRGDRDLTGSGFRVLFNGSSLEEYDKADPKARQEKLNDLFGTDYDTYTKSIILGQSVAANFITADESKRRVLIEQMLGLERIDEYLAQVREFKKTLRDQYISHQATQEAKGEQLSNLNRLVQALARDVRMAVEDYERKLSELAQKEHDTKVTIGSVQESIRGLELARDRALAQQDEAIGKMNQQVEKFAQKADVQKLAQGKRAEAQVIAGRLTSVRGTLSSRDAAVSFENQALDVAQKMIRRTEQELTELRSIDVEQIRQDNAQLTKLREELGQKRGAAGSKAQEVGQHGRVIEENAARSQKYTSIAQRFGGQDDCPTCGQSLSKQAIQKIVADADALATSAGELLRQAERERIELQSSVELTSQQTEELAARTKNLDQIRAIVQDIQAKQATIEQQGVVTTGHQEKLDAIETRFLTEALVHFPEDNGLMTIELIIDELQQTELALRKEAETLEAQVDLVSWNAAVAELQRRQTERASLAEGHARGIDESRVALNSYQTSLAASQMALKSLTQVEPATGIKARKEEQEAQRDRVQQEVSQAGVACMNVEQQQAYVKFWEQAFAAKGGFRSFLLSESVADLNRVLEGYLFSLDRDLPVTFEPDLTIRENYAKRSGGQRKCTDVAVLFAAFELVRQRSRHRSRIMILDELFESLDEKHHRAIIGVLEMLVQRVQKIFVITHKDITGCSMAGRLHTELTEQGSQVTITRT